MTHVPGADDGYDEALADAEAERHAAVIEAHRSTALAITLVFALMVHGAGWGWSALWLAALAAIGTWMPDDDEDWAPVRWVFALGTYAAIAHGVGYLVATLVAVAIAAAVRD